jgi:transcriptional regulator
MYRPSSFAEDRPDVLRALIERHPLGALVSVTEAGLAAEHVPMLFDGRKLRAHVARANPIWRTLPAGSPVLVIFQGAGAYVSPSLYPSKAESGKVVPTWNYAVVHVRGTIRFIEDVAWLRELVSELTDRHETGRPAPWATSDAPADYLEALLQGIVGLEIEVASIEGKWKASQNRSDEDRRGVADGLAAEGRSITELDELVRLP